MSAQYVTFRLAESRFGVSVHRVQEVVSCPELAPVPLASSEVAGLVNLRGQVITALDIRPRLGLTKAQSDANARPMMVVVQAAGETLAVLADEVGEVATVEEEEFEPAPATLDSALRTFITGAYKTDGPLLLLLDLDAACRSEN